MTGDFDSELRHFGVPGMRWGKRKGSDGTISTVSVTNTPSIGVGRGQVKISEVDLRPVQSLPKTAAVGTAKAAGRLGLLGGGMVTATMSLAVLSSGAPGALLNAGKTTASVVLAQDYSNLLSAL